MVLLALTPDTSIYTARARLQPVECLINKQTNRNLPHRSTFLIWAYRYLWANNLSFACVTRLKDIPKHKRFPQSSIFDAYHFQSISDLRCIWLDARAHSPVQFYTFVMLFYQLCLAIQRWDFFSVATDYLSTAKDDKYPHQQPCSPTKIGNTPYYVIMW